MLDQLTRSYPRLHETINLTLGPLLKVPKKEGLSCNAKNSAQNLNTVTIITQMCRVSRK